jgi:branched-chain amino acid transport system permease protein
VVLTGWVGQISLAQASFVGISALVTGLVVRGWGIGFPANLALSAAVAGVAAVVLGMAALRVRGLYLAVATLIFAWMVDSFLVPGPWLGADGGSSTIDAQHLGNPGGFPFVDLSDRRALLVVMVAVLVLVVFTLANLRDTRAGRAFFAVRGSEVAAVSLGIDVVRYKLIAFAVAGVVAGIAGNLLMVEQRTVVPAQFVVTVSLEYLAIAVVGGLGSLGGAVAAGAVFAGLHELFFRVSALAGWLDVVSAGLLAAVLLLYPGGLAALPDALRGRWDPVSTRLKAVAEQVRSAVPRVPRPLRTQPADTDWLAAQQRQQPAPARAQGSPASPTVPALTLALPASDSNGEPQRTREQRDIVLDARNVTVRFGGLTAVDDASIEVRDGEVVGLIGPNGAGKTTLFNAVLGLNQPASGRVLLHGADVTGMAPHLRARAGVARTFQVLQLFRELTVFDNVLVATHLHNHAGLLSNLLAMPTTLHAERRLRERVGVVLQLLRLDAVAGRPVQGLPFGTLRMVELARALVTGARLVMLDEPASGLNEQETDRLTEVLRGVRALGVSVLLIEHDVRMVAGVSDHVYMLDQGRMCADGPPDAVQRDPRVVAAYLGRAAAGVA